jgi:hypothetical protein
MISNEKSMNYKVVVLNEIYNFRVSFICIWVHTNEYIFLIYAIKSKNICVDYLSLKMISNEKRLN